MISPELLKAVEEARKNPEITQIQRVILGIIVYSQGKDKAITQDGILRRLQITGFPDLKKKDMRMVRNDINILRTEFGIPICAESGVGYFLPTCWEDVLTSTAVERAKAISIMVTVKNLRKVGRDFYPTGQLNMWL